MTVAMVASEAGFCGSILIVTVDTDKGSAEYNINWSDCRRRSEIWALFGGACAEMSLLSLDVQFLLCILVHLLDGGTLISRRGRLCPRRRRRVARQGSLSGKLLRRPSSGGLGLRGVIGQSDPCVEAQTGQGDSSGSNKFHRVPPMTGRRQCCRRFTVNAHVGRLCLVAGEFGVPHGARKQ